VRVASVVALAVAALLLVSAAGCSSSSTSKFCSTLTQSKLDFSSISQPSHELHALDQVLAQLSPKDRKYVAPVRDYARILYGRSTWSTDQKLQFLKHFFSVDGPALDRRLRKECDVPLDKRIAVFNNLTTGGKP
jgi:hypothetical protein